MKFLIVPRVWVNYPLVQPNHRMSERKMPLEFSVKVLRIILNTSSLFSLLFQTRVLLPSGSELFSSLHDGLRALHVPIDLIMMFLLSSVIILRTLLASFLYYEDNCELVLGVWR